LVWAAISKVKNTLYIIGTTSGVSINIHMKTALGKYSESGFVSPPQKERWKTLAQQKVNSSDRRGGNIILCFL